MGYHRGSAEWYPIFAVCPLQHFQDKFASSGFPVMCVVFVGDGCSFVQCVVDANVFWTVAGYSVGSCMLGHAFKLWSLCMTLATCVVSWLLLQVYCCHVLILCFWLHNVGCMKWFVVHVALGHEHEHAHK